jgi:hypothetical protein
MDQSSDNNKGDKIEPDASAGGSDSSASGAPKARSVDAGLPMILSPRLAGGDDFDADAETFGNPSGDAHAAREERAAPTRSSRFILLAWSIALAAAVGSFAGAMAGYGVGRMYPATASSSPPVVADTSVISRGMKAQLAELAALKTSFDSSIRNANTQLAGITERLDHVEHAQADAANTTAAAANAAKLAHIAEAVDRLNKTNASPETTGSITAAPPAPAAAPASASATASAPPAADKVAQRVIDDWIVQDVRGGRALVESRYGAMFAVSEGSVLPGLGRVETVKRQDGQWLVVTARGTITSGR